MSDLLLGLTNPTALLQPQQATPTQDPLTLLTQILANPSSIFAGVGEGNTNASANAFAMPQDFNTNFLVTSQQGLTGLPKDQTQEVPEKPEFSLPEEGVPKGNEPVDAKYKNADGKTKSWQEIREDSEVCKKFGGNAKDIKEIKEGAKQKFGDWENEKDPEKASRSYIKFRELLEYADNSKSKDGEDRGKEAGNGNLNGLTKGGDIRDGTELSTVVNYFRHGKGFVEETTKGGQLKDHNDKYVRANGSTRSDLGQVGVDIGKGIGHVIPGLGNFIAGVSDGFDKDGIDGAFKGGFEAVKYTAGNGLKLMDPTDPKGMGEAAKNLWGGGFTETL